MEIELFWKWASNQAQVSFVDLDDLRMIELVPILGLSDLEKHVGVIVNLRTYMVELVALWVLYEFIQLLRMSSCIPCNDVHYLGGLFRARVELKAGLAKPNVAMVYAYIGVHPSLRTRLLIDMIHAWEAFLI